MYKILVLGDAKTGKTSLVSQFVHSKFENTYKATISCEFALKILHLDGKPIRVQLWDIAGKERMSDMSNIYCRDAVGEVIVTDITKSDTLAQ